MNKSKLFSIFSLFFILLFTRGIQAQEQDTITAFGFTAIKAGNNVWRIDDHRNDNFYLVEGKERALLIDTGIGAGDLEKFVKSLTNLPLLVVNTHAHGDHINSDFQFKEVYIHPDEIEEAERNLTKENRANVISNILKNNPDYGEENILEVKEYSKPDFIPIDEEYIFDLGDRKLEVIVTPGHTPGCICLLDRENKLLFSGDNNCQHIWLFMNNSTSVETYFKSLERLMTFSEHFDTIFPGHLEPMGKEYLDEVHTCVKSILDGECEPKPYQSFGDNVRHCTYKRAIVAFNPENIFDKN